MAILVALLLFGCARAATVEDEVPPYGDLRDAIQIAVQVLGGNVISMEGNIPFLDDPRRHYAVILSVVYKQAVSTSACTEQNYYKDYQKNLNTTAHLGLVHTQGVIDGTRRLVAAVLNTMYDVIRMVNIYGPSSRETDKAIDEEIKNDKKLEKPQMVFMAAGLAAMELNKMDVDYFSPHSKNRSALKFVITGARRLRKLVVAVSDFYKVMYGIPEC